MASHPALVDRGLPRWQANGLVRPASVIAATESYFEDQDLMGQWLSEECDAEVGNTYKWEATAKLFESWTEFANHAGEVPGTMKAFGGKLSKLGFESFRAGHAKTRAYKGLRLTASILASASAGRRWGDDD